MDILKIKVPIFLPITFFNGQLSISTIHYFLTGYYCSLSLRGIKEYFRCALKCFSSSLKTPGKSLQCVYSTVLSDGFSPSFDDLKRACLVLTVLNLSLSLML